MAPMQYYLIRSDFVNFDFSKVPAKHLAEAKWFMNIKDNNQIKYHNHKNFATKSAPYVHVFRII